MKASTDSDFFLSLLRAPRRAEPGGAAPQLPAEAQHHQRDVVGLRRVLRERPYVIQNRIVNGVPGGCRVHRDDFPQPLDAVEFALRPPGLADAVAVDDHTIAGNKYRIRRRESRARDQPYRHTGGLERPDPPIWRNDQRRTMTRVDVAKPAILPQGAIKDSGVFLHFRPLDQ